MPVAAVVALVAVVVGFTVWAGATHSEQVLPRRDAASNLQAAVSLATTHARVVPVDAESVGGAEVLDLDGVTLASPAFFEVGSTRILPWSRSSSWARRWSTRSGGGPVAPASRSCCRPSRWVSRCSRWGSSSRGGRPWAGVATAALTGILFPVLHTAGRRTPSRSRC